VENLLKTKINIMKIMKNKFLFSILFLVVLCIKIDGQNNINDKLIPLTKKYFISNQAESVDRITSELAIDGKDATSTLIGNKNGHNWWQLNMKFSRNIEGVKIKAKNLSKFYLFISKAPFNHVNLNSLLQDPWARYIYVNELTDELIPISGICQYVMIVTVNGGSYELSEFTPYGYQSKGSDKPNIKLPNAKQGKALKPPYGNFKARNTSLRTSSGLVTVPEYIIGQPFIPNPIDEDPNDGDPNIGGGPDIDPPWWGDWEICDNGFDDDGNGLTDCDDFPCGVGFYNVIQTDPSCQVCYDGNICIYSYLPVTEVSIDGGGTWTSVPNTDIRETCFSNLPAGTYNVALKTSQGCIDFETVYLVPPLTNESGICKNGGFENGNFDGWSGGTASYYPTNFSNINFTPTQHAIVSQGTVDPYAPFISINNGAYSVRLGNTTASQSAQRLTYCLKVDNANADFSFNWAAVLQLPPAIGGKSHESGYFEYRIYDSATGQNLFQSAKTTASTPFLQTLDPINRAVGWTCQKHDLSSSINREVCIEFITSDCVCGGHFGYAYIDGLCNSFAPELDIKTNDTYCKDQKIGVDVVGNGFQQYNWRISKIDANGFETEVVTTPTENSPVVYPIDDLLQLYLNNGGSPFSCPQSLKLELIVYSGTNCGEYAKSKIINLICPNYTIDYCNPLYYCVGANTNTLNINGVNNCTNCEYEWNSDQGINGLVNRFAKFPYLDRSIAFDAFDKKYFVNIKTPEGCLYLKEVQTKPNFFELNITNIDYGYCSYKVTGTINFPILINPLEMAAIATNTLSNTSFPISFTQNGNIFNFEFTILRSESTRYRIDVNYSGNNNCADVTCKKSILLDAVGAPFFSQWKSAFPIKFSPNGDGNNDDFFLIFRSLKENRLDCTDMNLEKSSIYSYKLEIFDRVGSKVFQQALNVGLLNTKGILGDEIKWGGMFNGQLVVPDVYTWKATVESCYDGSNQCTDCSGGNGMFRKCATSGSEVFFGDITVVR
jgi:hypothetical protein